MPLPVSTWGACQYRVGAQQTDAFAVAANVVVWMCVCCVRCGLLVVLLSDVGVVCVVCCVRVITTWL